MADFTVRGAITIALEGNGAKDATVAVDSIAKSSRAAGAALLEASQEAAKLGQATETQVETEGLDKLQDEAEQTTEALREAGDSTKTFSEETREGAKKGAEALSGLAAALGDIGQRNSLEAISADLEKIATKGGPAVKETVPALEKLIAVTGDAPEAMRALSASIDIARERSVPLASVVDGLAALLRKDIPEAARLAGISLTDATGTAKGNAQLMREVEVAYGRVATSAKTLAPGIREATTAIKESDTATTSLWGSIKNLAGAFGIVLGVQQAFSFLKNAITDYANTERSLNAIGVAIRGLGLESGVATPKIAEALKEISLGGGARLSESLPAFQKFLGITRNTEAALYLTRLASNAAESGIASVSEATEALANIMQGRAAAGAKTLAIKLQDANGVVRDSGKLLREAGAQYGGLGDAFDDTREKIDRLIARWEELKRLGVGALAGAEQGVESVGDAFDTVADKTISATERIVAFWRSIREGRQVTVEELRQRDAAQLQGPDEVVPRTREEVTRQGQIDAEADRLRGRLEAERQAEQKAARQRVQAERQTAIEVAQARVDAEEELSPRKLAAQKELLALQKAAALDSAQETGESVERIEDSFRVREEALVSEHARKIADARASFEQKYQEQALQAEIAATKEGSAERLRLELQLLESKRQAELREADRLGADRAAVDEFYDRQRAALEREHLQRRVDVEREAQSALLDVQIQSTEEGSRERLDLELELLDQSYAAQFAAAEGNEQALTALRLAHALERSSKTIAAESAAAQREIDLRESAANDAVAAEQDALDTRLLEIERNSAEAFAIIHRQIELEAEARQIAADAQHAADEADIASAYARRDARIAAARDTAIAEAQAAAGYDSEGKSNLSIEARIAIENDFNSQLALSHEQMLADKQRADERYASATIGIANKVAATHKQIDKASARAKSEAYLEAASMVLGAMQTAFGQSKSLAIAQAIIDTILAVMKTLREPALPYPSNVIMAGAIAAVGAANVAKIASTNLGSSSSGAALPGGSAAGGGEPQRPRPLPPVQGQFGSARTVPKGEDASVAFARGGELRQRSGVVPGPDLGRDTVMARGPAGEPIGLRGGEVFLDPPASQDFKRRLAEAGVTSVAGPGGIGLTEGTRRILATPGSISRGFASGGEFTVQSALSVAAGPRGPRGSDGIDLSAEIARGVERTATAASFDDRRLIDRVDALSGTVERMQDRLAEAIAEPRTLRLELAGGSSWSRELVMQELQRDLVRNADSYAAGRYK